MSEVIVLASGSPRRRQLLEMIGLEFRVVPPEVDESLGPAEQAEGYVTRLAREKATTVAGRERGAVVLAADTAVAEDWGHVFNGEANIDRWSPRVAEVLRDQGITKLRIREGWQEPGLDPLVPFGDQITRIFVECDVPDLSALGQLRRLRELAMREGLATIDFTGLDQLEDLTTSGDTPRFGNLPEARALRRLHVVNCGLRDLTPLSALAPPAELETSEAPLKTLAGVAGLRSLRRLALF